VSTQALLLAACVAIAAAILGAGVALFGWWDWQRPADYGMALAWPLVEPANATHARLGLEPVGDYVVVERLAYQLGGAWRELPAGAIVRGRAWLNATVPCGANVTLVLRHGSAARAESFAVACLHRRAVERLQVDLTGLRAAMEAYAAFTAKYLEALYTPVITAYLTSEPAQRVPGLAEPWDSGTTVRLKNIWREPLVVYIVPEKYHCCRRERGVLYCDADRTVWANEPCPPGYVRVPAYPQPGRTLLPDPSAVPPPIIVMPGESVPIIDFNRMAGSWQPVYWRNMELKNASECHRSEQIDRERPATLLRWVYEHARFGSLELWLNGLPVYNGTEVPELMKSPQGFWIHYNDTSGKFVVGFPSMDGFCVAGELPARAPYSEGGGWVRLAARDTPMGYHCSNAIRIRGIPSYEPPEARDKKFVNMLPLTGNYTATLYVYPLSVLRALGAFFDASGAPVAPANATLGLGTFHPLRLYSATVVPEEGGVRVDLPVPARARPGTFNTSAYWKCTKECASERDKCYGDCDRQRDQCCEDAERAYERCYEECKEECKRKCEECIEKSGGRWERCYPICDKCYSDCAQTCRDRYNCKSCEYQHAACRDRCDARHAACRQSCYERASGARGAQPSSSFMLQGRGAAVLDLGAPARADFVAVYADERFWVAASDAGGYTDGAGQYHRLVRVVWGARMPVSSVEERGYESRGAYTVRGGGALVCREERPRVDPFLLDELARPRDALEPGQGVRVTCAEQLPVVLNLTKARHFGCYGGHDTLLCHPYDPVYEGGEIHHEGDIDAEGVAYIVYKNGTRKPIFNGSVPAVNVRTGPEIDPFGCKGCRVVTLPDGRKARCYFLVYLSPAGPRPIAACFADYGSVEVSVSESEVKACGPGGCSVVPLEALRGGPPQLVVQYEDDPDAGHNDWAVAAPINTIDVASGQAFCRIGAVCGQCLFCAYRRGSSAAGGWLPASLPLWGVFDPQWALVYKLEVRSRHADEWLDEPDRCRTEPDYTCDWKIGLHRVTHSGEAFLRYYGSYPALQWRQGNLTAYDAFWGRTYYFVYPPREGGGGGGGGGRSDREEVEQQEGKKTETPQQRRPVGHAPANYRCDGDGCSVDIVAVFEVTDARGTRYETEIKWTVSAEIDPRTGQVHIGLTDMHGNVFHVNDARVDEGTGTLVCGTCGK
jgi:hypothetical protein